MMAAMDAGFYTARITVGENRSGMSGNAVVRTGTGVLLSTISGWLINQLDVE